VSFEHARKVSSIRAEYEHIAGQRCTCGAAWEKVSQALQFDDNQTPHDRIEVKCSACGKKSDFLFDVSEFFGKPPKWD
jgi:hypothetical protein